MGEQLKKNIHIIIRLAIGFSFLAYAISSCYAEGKSGVSTWILLLVSCFISLLCANEYLGQKGIFALGLAFVAAVMLVWLCGDPFMLLVWFVSFEILEKVSAGPGWFFLPYLYVFVRPPFDMFLTLLIITLLLVCFVSYEFGIKPYREEVLKETVMQQTLKKNLELTESVAKTELKKSMLRAENQILEDRAELSQTLHDKLGHNINGSIYQLEASKVLMDKEPEKAKSMIQAVIDRLRTGMDEIRAILRKERPDKKQMALLQLYELCEDCNNKGVETELLTEGELSVIEPDVWEVILDNCFEAVSNAMKYAQCKHINISIVAMNKMIRVNIKDDGKGCKNIVDGMGLSGMRQRIRQVGGTIDFESMRGFKINMLIPLS